MPMIIDIPQVCKVYRCNVLATYCLEWRVLNISNHEGDIMKKILNFWKMSQHALTSPSKSDAPPVVQIHELTSPTTKKSSGCDAPCVEPAAVSPRSGLGTSPSKHNCRTQGRHNLRLAWAKSSNFRNTLSVPHGGSTHSVCSGKLWLRIGQCVDITCIQMKNSQYKAIYFFYSRGNIPSQPSLCV